MSIPMSQAGGHEAYFRQGRSDVAVMVPTTCSSILELGCGFGALGRTLMQRQPCVVDGVEINPAAAVHLKGRYRRFWIGDVERSVLEGAANDYDCLLCPDVLEHLVDPWAALKRFSALLRPGGVVVASIPNIRNLAIPYRLIARGRWEYEDSGLRDRGHLRFITRSSIDGMCADSGLVIEEWSLKRDACRGGKRLVAMLAKICLPEIDVCQYIVRARKP